MLEKLELSIRVLFIYCIKFHPEFIQSRTKFTMMQGSDVVMILQVSLKKYRLKVKMKECLECKRNRRGCHILDKRLLYKNLWALATLNKTGYILNTKFGEVREMESKGMHFKYSSHVMWPLETCSSVTVVKVKGQNNWLKVINWSLNLHVVLKVKGE